jgi:hypothetical protein
MSSEPAEMVAMVRRRYQGYTWCHCSILTPDHEPTPRVCPEHGNAPIVAEDREHFRADLPLGLRSCAVCPPGRHRNVQGQSIGT